jgi:hypothetical protein
VAIRQEELGRSYVPGTTEGRVVRFPTAAARARARRQQRVVFMRRRVAVGALLVALVVGVLSIGGVGTSAPAAADGSPRHVVLQEGETLWSLADRYAPEGSDPRAFVDRVVDLNQLQGAPQAGAKIKLPR